MPVVPGFKYDLFVSYAHRNDVPLRPGAYHSYPGWVTEFINALKVLLEEKDREFTLWSDPQLRSGDDFNDAIAEGISESAVFMSVLSPAYENSEYCKKEIFEFRRQRHPAFQMKVGTMSRMQAIVLEELSRDSWPPELRTTSPPCFFNEDVERFYPPDPPDQSHPYIKALWKARKSVWEALAEMKKQKQQGTVIERSYDVQSSQSLGRPMACLAEVADSLYFKGQELRAALQQLNEFEITVLSDLVVPSGPAVLSVHLFDRTAGRPYPGADVHLSRLQLQAALASNPARRPLVWLARDLKPEDADTKAHQDFLRSLLSHDGIELIRTGFEDLKDEIQMRMRPRTSPVVKNVRRVHKEPIVHIWHQVDSPQPLIPLKKYLIGKNCGISVFAYSNIPKEQLQSKLSSCDGLIVPYTSETKTWAEDVLTEAFRLRRNQDLPIAFAPMELPPPSGAEFNFEHPRVVSVHSSGSEQFQGIDEFLQKLEEEDV